MSKQVIGYKVVLNLKDEHTNKECYVSIKQYDLTKIVEYKKGKWAKPYKKNGPLVVFDTFEHAESWALNHCAQFKIFICKYIPSNKLKIWKTYFFKKGLKTIIFDRSERMLYDLPNGSCLAKKVKILMEYNKDE